MIRSLDFLAAFLGLLLLSPLLLVFMLLVWLQDGKSPFYLAPRVGKGGSDFTMVKLRSMVVNADKSGVDSTAGDDRRITRVGRLVRKFKLDELTQLWNVLKGDMSLVGPRPQVRRDVDLYTDVEKGLLTVRPGITDLASIVFSDEGSILEGKTDPDLAYNQLIRPWKSRLALLTIANHTLRLHFKVVLLTLVSIFDRQRALTGVQQELRRMGADPDVTVVAGRTEALAPHPPPGADGVVTSREDTSQPLTAVPVVQP